MLFWTFIKILKKMCHSSHKTIKQHNCCSNMIFIFLLYEVLVRVWSSELSGLWRSPTTLKSMNRLSPRSGLWQVFMVTLLWVQSCFWSLLPVSVLTTERTQPSQGWVDFLVQKWFAQVWWLQYDQVVVHVSFCWECFADFYKVNPQITCGVSNILI